MPGILPSTGYIMMNNSLESHEAVDVPWLTRTQIISSGTKCYVRGKCRVLGEENTDKRYLTYRRVFRMLPKNGS